MIIIIFVQTAEHQIQGKTSKAAIIKAAIIKTAIIRMAAIRIIGKAILIIIITAHRSRTGIIHTEAALA